MGRIVVCAGSVIGLSVATMLAADGHEVTVLESDGDGAPGSPQEAWMSWRRRGVAQFRQPHNRGGGRTWRCRVDSPHRPVYTEITGGGRPGRSPRSAIPAGAS